jgi:hypothetical protein
VAFTLAEEGETRATVRHRTGRLAFCAATVEHAHCEVVAEAAP